MCSVTGRADKTPCIRCHPSQGAPSCGLRPRWRACWCCGCRWRLQTRATRAYCATASQRCCGAPRGHACGAGSCHLRACRSSAMAGHRRAGLGRRAGCQACMQTLAVPTCTRLRHWHLPKHRSPHVLHLFKHPRTPGCTAATSLRARWRRTLKTSRCAQRRTTTTAQAGQRARRSARRACSTCERGLRGMGDVEQRT